ncbi:DHA2 family efflux MFS transporter permease subunit [Microbacterium gorillae]|uniref:DHA2 family efflux MFS transporter permease subunit n=1 Tax=Microbacterium gorillae TaxID=1231063 RepID=UPI00058EE11C|nr:DHA2 family efflux MFS transporter permease subunit [Microbacterium gorillae]
MSPTDRAADDALDPQTRRIIAVLVFGGIAGILDTTVVTIALHSLSVDLHSPIHEIQWVSTAYLLALVAVIPLAGWLEVRLGGRRIWLIALGVFVVGSALCAAAWNPGSLIAFRVLQGLGAGLLSTLMQTIAVQAAAGRSTARVMASISLPLGIAPVLGPVLGGLILAIADWRWVFLINVPICLIGFVAAWRVLPPGRPDGGSSGPLDLAGLAMLVPGVSLLVFGLTQTVDSVVPSALVGGALVLGTVLLVGFVIWAVRRDGRALIRVRLLTRRRIAASAGLMFLLGAFMFGGIFLLPLYWQIERGQSVLTAALLLMPQGIGSLVARFLVARTVLRFGSRNTAMVAFVVVAVATVPFAFAGPDTSPILLAATLLVRGLGIGMLMVPLTSNAYETLERTDIAQVAMQTRLLQQLGGAFGTASAAVLLQGATVALGAPAAFRLAFGGFVILGICAAAATVWLPRRAPVPTG